MNCEQEIQLLESEWLPDVGFFWRVRQGVFNSAEFQRVLQKISAFSFDETAMLPRRIVSLLWYIPIYMYWQVERVQEIGGTTEGYAKAIAAMTNEIERLLGVP